MIRCIAIDDEPLALRKLTDYIRKTPFLELVKDCPDALSAMQVLAEESIDLMFVDINMPDLNGMEFVKLLTVKPMIVFTTAYSEFAIEGFKVDAMDYLLKPFSYEDFLHAAEKAGNRQALLRRTNTPQEREPGMTHLFVKADYKMVRIALDDIIYIEGQSEYIRIFTETGKPLMTHLSMKAVEERLPGTLFMRVHRSYIVNLVKVKEVARNRIVYDGKTYIPVGDQYKEKFYKYLNANSLTR